MGQNRDSIIAGKYFENMLSQKHGMASSTPELLVVQTNASSRKATHKVQDFNERQTSLLGYKMSES